MADILIRGVDMPPENTFNIVYIYSDGSIGIPTWGKGVTKVDSLQAIKLPPHGGLIDRDALFRTMFTASDGTIMRNGNIDGWPFEMRYADIKKYIKTAPIIVPAEGGREDV